MGNKKGTKGKSDNEKTKKVKTVKTTNKKKKGKHPKLMKAIKIIAVIIILMLIIGTGVVAGVFFGLFGDELKISVDDLDIKMENSVLIDLNGNEVARLNGEENREIITLAEMGEYLPKAFIAIEDKRFEQHNGVDIKRTIGATIKYVLGDSSYGGSTITQQLIKNATGDDDRSWMRKVKEISKAFQIEREMSKNQILESYLNTIPLGGGAKNVYGVKVASNYYFDKKPIDLSIAEAAYIAGINHSPNIYNPFKEKVNTEKINKRIKVVLSEMLDQEKINKEQYDEAINQVEAGLTFKEGVITSNNSLTQNEEAAVKQVAREYANEHDLDYNVAEQKIKSGGYRIYITEDKNVQAILDDAYTNNADWIKTKTVTKKKEDGTTYKDTIQLQSAMVIIDHKTGYVIASRGVLGEKTAWGINRATKAAYQPGSCMKPIAVIAPSLQEGLITAGTVVDDVSTAWGTYKPNNYDHSQSGLVNIRYILKVSKNIPEVKMLQRLTPAKSIEYLKKFGITSLSDEHDNGLALALGGIYNGTSPLEMAGAYATIANDGVYIEPTFYTKVEDSNGTIILEKKQETHRVISEQNAYITKSLLTEPTGTGLTGAAGATGGGAVIKGQQTCGKTGTTNDDTYSWFVGFTPYYTASMYFGYDEQENGINAAPGSGTVSRRWSGIMTKVHQGLASAQFEKPSGIVNANICKDSGLIVTELCSQDPRGSRTYSEMFASGTVPNKICSTHVKLKICKDTGKIANEFCTNTEEKVFITRSGNDSSWKNAADAQYMAPTENCDKHTTKPDTTKPVITLPAGTKDSIEIKVNDKFVLPVPTAKDDVDGDISKNIKTEIKKDGKVVSNIDTKTAGTYIITYSVTDAAGNIGTKSITVKVVANNSNTNTNTNNTTNTKPNNPNTNTTNETTKPNTSNRNNNQRNTN